MAVRRGHVGQGTWHGLGPGVRRVLLSALCCAGLLSLSGPKVGAARNVADSRELDDLMSMLESQTQLATKTGMNADFVPGMATILSGDDLLARGARTVWEALALVPGMSQGLEMTGERQVLSRGVGYGYASGNIKIMLDGVSMNSTLLATANGVLNIPIEQVERIDVIRGPGSSVYGGYAYAGVVNVITRKRERRLHAQAAEVSDAGGGVVWNWTDPRRALSFSMNLAGLEGDGEGVPIAQDALYPSGQSELSNAPGRTNEAHRYKSLFADLDWHKTRIDLKLLEDDYGDLYGINHFLPPSDHRLASQLHFFSLRLQQDVSLSQQLDGHARIEVLEHQRNREQLYVFPASYLDDEPIYMNQDYTETRYLGAAELQWRPSSRHQWLLGLEASHVGVDKVTWDWPDLDVEIPATWLDADLRRDILSTVLQDQFQLDERVTLTGTLRYDDYNDVGSMLSPRLAAVWRIDEQQVLKAQYARAFRPPTFYELEYALQESLEASEIATYELGYIFNTPHWVARVTAFQSELTAPITFDEVTLDGYLNSEDTLLRGVELEYEHRLGAQLKVDANVSYVEATHTESGAHLSGGADLLGNLALLWRPRESWIGALQLKYVGERHRVDSDERSDPGAYVVTDLTLNYRESPRGPYVSAGIKNLFDQEVRYLEQRTRFGGVDLLYPDDYLRPGRRWWLSVGFAF
ncbi:TonB-dependent receptor plug domain-containing protein [Thiocystis violacea]|uniref:TonB-dependent receptor plug domain-containing protein n=1 Tax=Thiocystis violacea TaxID=13725 RepID=UPI00190353E0|nr:TonB-dependent receptor [Thiocystis violacea]MBK1721136.1 TonB-dependent receptor [Thiocystis violacea]